jgi:type II secretory pathway component GspD/PulD (secretin)
MKSKRFEFEFQQRVAGHGAELFERRGGFHHRAGNARQRLRDDQGQHITKDEAVDLLNSELNRNNYAAIRDGRTLTIVNKNDAKTAASRSRSATIRTNIPNNDEIATWIIPIRFVEARQLVSDLSLFVSPQATVVANEAGNSIVVTDTQANIRHLVQIIQGGGRQRRVGDGNPRVPLQHASPVDVASELSSVFPSSSSSGSQSPFLSAVAGGGGGGGGWRRWRIWRHGGHLAAEQSVCGPFGGGGKATQQRIQKATQVTAVADSRIQAVIVTAPKDLMTKSRAS